MRVHLDAVAYTFAARETGHARCSHAITQRQPCPDLNLGHLTAGEIALAGPSTLCRSRVSPMTSYASLLRDISTPAVVLERRCGCEDAATEKGHAEEKKRIRWFGFQKVRAGLLVCRTEDPSHPSVGPPMLPQEQPEQKSVVPVEEQHELMGSQDSGRCLDLLTELAVLHSLVEKELETVQIAVIDVLNHQRTQASSSAKAGRLLGGARKRILDALARQRSLLWEFSEKVSPTPAQTSSRGGTGLRTNCQRNRAAPAVWSFSHEKNPSSSGIYDLWGDATIPCRHQSGSKSKGDRRGQARSGDLEWKRDTLMRMQNLLRRKAEDGTASEADAAVIRRDMAKIEAALERFRRLQQRKQIHRCTMGVPGERRVPESAQSGGGTSQITAAMVTGEDRSATAKAERVMEADDRSGNIRVRTTSWQEATARERGGIPAASSATGRCHGGGDDGRRSLWAAKSGCADQPVRQEELRLPDGLEFLLRRISEGVRPSRRGATQGKDEDDRSAGRNDKGNAKHSSGGGKKFARNLGISPTTSMRPTGVGLFPPQVSGGIPDEREEGQEVIAQLTAVFGQLDRVIGKSGGSSEGCRRASREASGGITNVGKEKISENLVAGGYAFREEGEGVLSTRAAKEIETTQGMVYEAKSRRIDPKSAAAPGEHVWGVTTSAGHKALSTSTDAVAAANVRPVPELAPQTHFRALIGVPLKMRLAGRALRGGSEEKENYPR